MIQSGKMYKIKEISDQSMKGKYKKEKTSLEVSVSISMFQPSREKDSQLTVCAIGLYALIDFHRYR